MSPPWMVLAALLALTATCGPITESGQLGTQPTKKSALATPGEARRR
jgi:hypothetical protein